VDIRLRPVPPERRTAPTHQRTTRRSDMSATGIRVTPEQLQQISAQLDAGASTIEGTLRQLAGNVTPLGSDWAGVAQSRFLELWAEWQRSGATLHQALTGIARLTARAGASYESAEHGIAASFGRT
jgi:early secretory antigenic target protein ESAT-6